MKGKALKQDLGEIIELKCCFSHNLGQYMCILYVDVLLEILVKLQKFIIEAVKFILKGNATLKCIVL